MGAPCSPGRRQAWSPLCTCLRVPTCHTFSHHSNQGPAYGPESPGPPPWQPAGLPVPECLLDGSVSLVAMFHAHQAGGPLLQDVLLLHVDGLYFRAGLQWRVEVMWTLVSHH